MFVHKYGNVSMNITSMNITSEFTLNSEAYAIPWLFWHLDNELLIMNYVCLAKNSPHWRTREKLISYAILVLNLVSYRATQSIWPQASLEQVQSRRGHSSTGPRSSKVMRRTANRAAIRLFKPRRACTVRLSATAL